MIYNSLLSCRLAEGLLKSTLPKLFRNSDLNSISMSPSNTLNTLLPPTLSTCCANRNAIVESEICLAWSISHTPLTFGAKSERTTSALQPKISAILLSMFGSSMLPCRIIAPATGVTGLRSIPMTFPDDRTSFTATCSHPPGAHPRSTTLSPFFIMW